MRSLRSARQPRGGARGKTAARLAAAAFVAGVFALALACVLLGPAPAAQALPEAPSVTITPRFPSGEPLAPDITAIAALVMDADTGEVLFAKNPDKRLPMASTTKIMTAIIVLEALALDEKVMISRNAHFQSGSVIGLQALEVVTVEQLLYGLLLFSGNDAAVALAEKTSGNEAKFVAKMNEEAKRMGLTNTQFQNPNGLNASEHYSSCSDLAVMTRRAMQDPVFRKIVDTPVYYLPHPTRPLPRELKNGNSLLHKYEWIDGVKTGSTPYAGYCVVASGTRDGVSLLVVLLGATNDATRWVETEALFRYGFGLCPKTILTEPGRVVTQLALGDPLDLHVGLVAQERVTARLWKDQRVIGTVSLEQGLALPLDAGDKLGSITFTLDGEALESVDLFAQHALYVPTVRDMVRQVRNWYLPAFVLTDRQGRIPR